MKKIFFVFALLLISSFATLGQDGAAGKPQPTDADKTAAIPADSFLKRGAPIGKAEKVSLNAALKEPGKFADKTVLIEGVIVRSCKMEGCWAEVAETKDGKSVRVKMKAHAFFIPLDAAGAQARVEGTFQVKTLSKAMVDHMVEEDGAKFDSRNADGSVSEIAFEATGIELKRVK